MKPEKQFQKDLEKVAALNGYMLIDIPDAPQSAELRYKNREKKRPFDCVLVAPAGVWCIELKYGYNKLMPHQLALHRKIGDVNNKAVIILRKIQLTNSVVYREEYITPNGLHIITKTTDKIEDLI
jgi:hypothetical protein